jgi:Arc/MetJ-type ribon-helix-helix transcriptional regulator
MQTLNIAIPDSLSDYVLRQVEEQGYGSADEYVGALIRAAQKDEFWRHLEKEFLIGLESGPGIEVTPEYWQKMWERVERRHAMRQGQKQ